MSGLVTAISTGVTAFVATNIDDLVILLVFFTQVNNIFSYRHIIIGQYVGFSLIVIASLSGFFTSLILPQYWLGLLGLIPVAIGLSSLLNQEPLSEEAEAETAGLENSFISSFLSPQTYSVAAITLANGSDNISIYVPLFASSNLGSIAIIISIFFLLIAVLCYAAYKLTCQPKIAELLTRYGNILVPFILIGLGIFIVLKSESLSLLKLVASCLCLMVLVKDDERSPSA